MAEYLVVSDAASPVAEGDAASAVSGLARALVAPRRLFVLPAGTACPPLTRDERAALGPNSELEALAAESLVSLGAADADAVVVPSPSSKAALERDEALAARASDQPIVAVR